MSIIRLADVTLSLIQQHWSLINSSTPLGLIVNVACEAYFAAQSITAETNLINNANIVGKNEKNLICPTNSIKDPNLFKKTEHVSNRLHVFLYIFITVFLYF